MNTVDLKAVIASWGLYAPHGAEKPELRTYVSEKYHEIMAERVKRTSILVQNTLVSVDKSVGTEAPHSTTSYIGSDEPISTSSCAASDGAFHHVFTVDDPLRTPLRMMTYDAALAATSSRTTAKPKIEQKQEKQKPKPKQEKPGRLIRDNGDILV